MPVQLHARPAPRRSRRRASGPTSSAISIPIRMSTTCCNSPAFTGPAPTASPSGASGPIMSARTPSRASRRCPSEGAVNEHARQGALHHRHRLPRRREDHAGAPRAGECRRPPPRRDRQRVRRCRHRRRYPEELRHRELPRGRDRRAGQRLHLLHRGRRLRAGAEGPARPAEPARAYRDRDLGPRACPSRWSRPSTGPRSPRA